MSDIKAKIVAHMCNCVGPQNGQPKCPCMMQGLIQRDGRWIEPEHDLGPVSEKNPFSLSLSNLMGGHLQ